MEQELATFLSLPSYRHSPRRIQAANLSSRGRGCFHPQPVQLKTAILNIPGPASCKV